MILNLEIEMKKINLIVIVLLTAIILSSCKQLSYIPGADIDNSDRNVLPTGFTYSNSSDDLPLERQYRSDKYIDGCIYYTDVQGIVRCYDPVSNIKTYACKNPLCLHNDLSCPFYSFFESTYHDGRWYFLKSAFKNGEEYRCYSCYDPETNTEKEIGRNNTDISGGMSIASWLIDGGYIYYYEVSCEHNDDETEYLPTLMRMSVNTGESEKLMSFSVDGFGMGYDYLLFANEGKIYLCEQGKGVYYIYPDGGDGYEKHFVYIADYPDFGVMLECCQLISDELFIGDISISDSETKTLFYKVSPEGEKTMLAEIGADCAHTFFTRQYVYFVAYEGTKRLGTFIDKDGNEGDLNVKVKKIYRMDHDGNIETVFDGFPDKPPYETCEIMNDVVVVGNYLYTQYENYGAERKEIYYEGGDEYSNILPGLMRLDLTTGEMIYVSGDK